MEGYNNKAAKRWKKKLLITDLCWSWHKNFLFLKFSLKKILSSGLTQINSKKLQIAWLQIWLKTRKKRTMMMMSPEDNHIFRRCKFDWKSIECIEQQKRWLLQFWWHYYNGLSLQQRNGYHPTDKNSQKLLQMNSCIPIFIQTVKVYIKNCNYTKNTHINDV